MTVREVCPQYHPPKHTKIVAQKRVLFLISFFLRTKDVKQRMHDMIVECDAYVVNGDEYGKKKRKKVEKGK